MGRWVLLRHDLPDGSWHFDWMMQRAGTAEGAALTTFRVMERPDDPRVWEVAAERLPDHRAVYLEYEGEVSGGRGRVTRVARGSCLILRDDDAEFCVHMLDAPTRRWVGVPMGADGYRFRAE